MLSIVTTQENNNAARRAALSYAAHRANTTGRRYYVLEVSSGYVVRKHGDTAPAGSQLIFVAHPEH